MLGVFGLQGSYRVTPQPGGKDLSYSSHIIERECYTNIRVTYEPPSNAHAVDHCWEHSIRCRASKVTQHMPVPG